MEYVDYKACQDACCFETLLGHKPLSCQRRQCHAHQCLNSIALPSLLPAGRFSSGLLLLHHKYLLPVVPSCTSKFLGNDQHHTKISVLYADLAPPQPGRPVPRVITFQRKRANRRVINEDQLVRMLREFAEVSLSDLCQNANRADLYADMTLLFLAYFLRAFLYLLTFC